MRIAMSKLILLVDDDVTVLQSLFPILEQAGHRVLVAPGGKEAARAIEVGRFDVIVTDIFMPDLDGLELIRLARIADSAARIVAMSDYDRHSGFHILAIAQQLGADATLQKPIETASLLDAVGRPPSARGLAAPLLKKEPSNVVEF
jgi:CheY-like chemotaxis protein